MGNTCFSSFAFYSNNKTQLSDLHNKIYEYTSTVKVNNTFYTPEKFLGNILNGFGFDYEKYNCRGAVLETSEIIKNYFQVDTETSWSPLTKMWDDILEKYYPDVKYFLRAEECEDSIFINTDSEHVIFHDKYYAACDLDIDDYDYFSDEASLIKTVTEWLKSYDPPVFNNIEEINRFLEENDIQNEVHICEFSTEKYGE